MAAAAASALAPDSAAPASSNVAEVIVTSQRRSENIQHVPISVQALSTQTLEQHQILDLAGLTEQLPSVSFQTLGPGRSDLFFRGISTGGGGLPTSGFYLDDTPLQTSDRTPDVHLYDIARVEALSGPQGTLFGASSLAGTLRLITNKPELSRFSAAYDVQGDKYGDGGGGGMAEGYVNIPLTSKAALRLVAYYDHEGGYINNTLQSLTYTFANQYPGQSLTVNNADLVKKGFNPVENLGGRAALRVDLDENWTFTPQLVYQSQRSEGSFLYDPKLPDLSVHDFGPTRNTDNWYLASATLQGHTGLFDIVYSGSYFDRKVSTANDYTYYSVAYDSYPGYTYFPKSDGTLLNPTQRYREHTDYTKETNELRASLSGSGPIHLTAGLFQQQQNNLANQNYYVPGLGATGNPIAVYGDDVFYIRERSIYRDYAVFAEAGWDILPTLKFIAGVRGFVADNRTYGFSGVPGSANRVGCTTPLTAAEAQSCTNIREHIYETGETHKFNLSWQIDPSRMIYATYSTGFRPGGANTLAGVKPYNADTLTNYEGGFKTTWFNHLRWNGALYYEEWSGMQYRLVVPGNNGIGATYNAGSARVYGVETDVQLHIKDFTLSSTASYNDARLAKDLCNLGVDRNQLPSCTPGPTTAAVSGTHLPNQPPFKISATARYDVPLGWLNGFVQGVVNNQTKATSYISSYEDSLLGNTPGFTTFDFSVGGSWGDKTVQLFVQNAFDERGQLARNTFCAIDICSGSTRVYPIRPQFFGIKFGQKL